MYGFPFAKTDVAIGDLVAERARVAIVRARRSSAEGSAVGLGLSERRLLTQAGPSDVLVAYAFGTRTLTILT